MDLRMVSCCCLVVIFSIISKGHAVHTSVGRHDDVDVHSTGSKSDVSDTSFGQADDRDTTADNSTEFGQESEDEYRQDERTGSITDTERRHSADQQQPKNGKTDGSVTTDTTSAINDRKEKRRYSEKRSRFGHHKIHKSKKQRHRSSKSNPDGSDGQTENLQKNEQDSGSNERSAVGELFRESSNVHINGGSCPKCAEKEALKQMRIAMVKDALLRKLQLSSVPNISTPIQPLPFDFYVDEGLHANDEPDVEEDTELMARTRQLFIYGDDITDLCMQKRSVGCYIFNLTDRNIDADRVGSIELWIYKQRDPNDHHAQTFMVSELAPQGGKGQEVLRFRNIVKRVETKLDRGWMKVYVKRTVQRWLSKPHRNFGLAVVCKTCRRHSHKAIFGGKEGLKPILVFHMKQQGQRRSKRSTHCIEGGRHCCHKEALEINFQDIGWDFIFYPASIHPGFCAGSCNGILAAHYNHTRLVQSYKQTMLPKADQMMPCCTPMSFQSQTLMYIDHNNGGHKIVVPDLLVSSCGCA